MLRHLRHQYSVQGQALLRFGVTTFLCVACAAKSEDPPPSNPSSGGASSSGKGGGGAVFASGGSPGNGGSPFATGGTTALGGAVASGGAPTTSAGAKATGGTPTASGGVTTGTGGTPTASGGVTTGTGGTPTASGGATPTGGSGGGSSTCGTYAGAAKADSKIFVDGFGTSGTWKGYAYTYTYGMATVVPGKSTSVSCFMGKGLCAQGTIPGDYASGAGIGWNLNQALGAPEGPVVVAGNVQIQLTGAVAAMRIGLGPHPLGEEFCYTLTATDVTMANAGLLSIPVANFKQYCYNPATHLMPPIPYAGQMIKSIQVSVPGDMAAAKTFDFCLIDIKSG